VQILDADFREWAVPTINRSAAVVTKIISVEYELEQVRPFLLFLFAALVSMRSLLL
jgi:hypothetical protein